MLDPKILTSAGSSAAEERMPPPPLPPPPLTPPPLPILPYLFDPPKSFLFRIDGRLPKRLKGEKALLDIAEIKRSIILTRIRIIFNLCTRKSNWLGT
jgi:hypothetical protein